MREAGAKTLDRLLAKHPDDADAIRTLADLDPTGNYKWLPAMYQWYTKGSTIAAIEDAVDALDRFWPALRKHKLRWTPAQFESPGDVLSTVNAAEDTGLEPRLRKKDARYDVVATYPRQGLTIYRVYNEEASCILGAGSYWCTAKWRGGHWDSNLAEYGGNDVYIARFNDGRMYMVRVANKQIVSAYDRENNAVLGRPDRGARFVFSVLATLGIGEVSGAEQINSYLFDVVGIDDDRGTDWIDAKFSVPEAIKWIDVGIYDPDVADELRLEGIDPSDVESVSWDYAPRTLTPTQIIEAVRGLYGYSVVDRRLRSVDSDPSTWTLDIPDPKVPSSSELWDVFRATGLEDWDRLEGPVKIILRRFVFLPGGEHRAMSYDVAEVGASVEEKVYGAAYGNVSALQDARDLVAMDDNRDWVVETMSRDGEAQKEGWTLLRFSVYPGVSDDALTAHGVERVDYYMPGEDREVDVYWLTSLSAGGHGRGYVVAINTDLDQLKAQMSYYVDSYRIYRTRMTLSEYVAELEAPSTENVPFRAELVEEGDAGGALKSGAIAQMGRWLAPIITDALWIRWIWWEQGSDGIQASVTVAGPKAEGGSKGDWVARATRPGRQPFAWRESGTAADPDAAREAAVEAINRYRADLGAEPVPALEPPPMSLDLATPERKRDREPSAAVRSWDAAALEAAAVDQFGVTDDPRLAGFILRDGRMLDFSAGGGLRALDHRDISQVDDDLPGGTEGLEEFMRATGAIRMGLYGTSLHLDAEAPVTPAQLATISRLLRAGRYEVEASPPGAGYQSVEPPAIWKVRLALERPLPKLAARDAAPLVVPPRSPKWYDGAFRRLRELGERLLAVDRLLSQTDSELLGDLGLQQWRLHAVTILGQALVDMAQNASESMELARSDPGYGRRALSNVAYFIRAAREQLAEWSGLADELAEMTSQAREEAAWLADDPAYAFADSAFFRVLDEAVDALREAEPFTEYVVERIEAAQSRTWSRRERPDTPDTAILYHATVNARQIHERGFAPEVPGEGGLGGAQSLGGDAWNERGTSFTADIYIATQIARTLKEAIGIANGDIGWRDVQHWAAAEGVWEDTKRLFGGSRRRVPQQYAVTRYEPQWAGPALDDPKNVFSLYRTYLALSKRRYDPVFFGVSVDQFRGLDPSDVGVVAAEVDMTDPGVTYVGSMEEWRVPPRAIRRVVGPRIAKQAQQAPSNSGLRTWYAEVQVEAPGLAGSQLGAYRFAQMLGRRHVAPNGDTYEAASIRRTSQQPPTWILRGLFRVAPGTTGQAMDRYWQVWAPRLIRQALGPTNQPPPGATLGSTFVTHLLPADVAPGRSFQATADIPAAGIERDDVVFVERQAYIGSWLVTRKLDPRIQQSFLETDLQDPTLFVPTASWRMLLYELFMWQGPDDPDPTKPQRDDVWQVVNIVGTTSQTPPDMELRRVTGRRDVVDVPVDDLLALGSGWRRVGPGKVTGMPRGAPVATGERLLAYRKLEGVVPKRGSTFIAPPGRIEVQWWDPETRLIWTKDLWIPDHNLATGALRPESGVPTRRTPTGVVVWQIGDRVEAVSDWQNVQGNKVAAGEVIELVEDPSTTTTGDWEYEEVIDPGGPADRLVGIRALVHERDLTRSWRQGDIRPWSVWTAAASAGGGSATLPRAGDLYQRVGSPRSGQPQLADVYQVLSFDAQQSQIQLEKVRGAGPDRWATSLRDIDDDAEWVSLGDGSGGTDYVPGDRFVVVRSFGSFRPGRGLRLLYVDPDTGGLHMVDRSEVPAADVANGNVARIAPAESGFQVGQQFQVLKPLWDSHGNEVYSDAIIELVDGPDSRLFPGMWTFTIDGEPGEHPITDFALLDGWRRGVLDPILGTSEPIPDELKPEPPEPSEAKQIEPEQLREPSVLPAWANYLQKPAGVDDYVWSALVAGADAVARTEAAGGTYTDIIEITEALENNLDIDLLRGPLRTVWQQLSAAARQHLPFSPPSPRRGPASEDLGPEEQWLVPRTRVEEPSGAGGPGWGPGGLWARRLAATSGGDVVIGRRYVTVGHVQGVPFGAVVIPRRVGAGGDVEAEIEGTSPPATVLIAPGHFARGRMWPSLLMIPEIGDMFEVISPIGRNLRLQRTGFDAGDQVRVVGVKGGAPQPYEIAIEGVNDPSRQSVISLSDIYVRLAPVSMAVSGISQSTMQQAIDQGWDDGTAGRPMRQDYSIEEPLQRAYERAFGRAKGLIAPHTKPRVVPDGAGGWKTAGRVVG